MPTATFIHDGEAIDYTPAADTPSGAVVVLGDLVGVTRRDVPANTLGSLALEGVFDLPKAAGSGIAAGTSVYWDAANTRVTTTATGNKLVGKTTRAAASADTTVRVRLAN